jgi:predicted XRE-type DNA-binding protein
MEAKTRKRLEADGWRIGSTQDFLGLNDAELELIDMHLRLIDEIKRRLERRGISQSTLARELGTSASRVSSMLAGKQVSTDALIRILLVLGAKSADVGRVVGGTRSKPRKRAA